MIDFEQLIKPDALRNYAVDLYRKNSDWLEFVVDGDLLSVRVRSKDPRLLSVCAVLDGLDRGNQLISLRAIGAFFNDGPKVFIPTKDQIDALSNIKVNLRVNEYSQPFPVMGVYFPDYDDTFVLTHLFPPAIVTTVFLNTDSGRTHFFLGSYKNVASIDPCEYGEDERISAQTDTKINFFTRVSLNACLALSNFDNYMEYLYPDEVEKNRNLLKGKLGKRKRSEIQEKLKNPPMVLKFHQHVKLFNQIQQDSTQDDNGTGQRSKVKTHWRRGHWAMQPYGEGRSKRKQILRPPVLVNSEHFYGDKSETGATYQG